MAHRPRILCIGEAMLELSRREQAGGAEGGWAMGYGGDTLNTAIHLARAGHNVAYLTALGCDPMSAVLKASWTEEGLYTSLIISHPTRSNGLYAINTDPSGERSFTYWRDTNAARDMFALPGMETALAAAEEVDMMVYSLITLANLPPSARDQLFALCGRVRKRGGKVVFDGNYRQRLWACVEEACTARDAAIGCADIGLPTLKDECRLSGEASAWLRGNRRKTGIGWCPPPRQQHLASTRGANPHRYQRCR